VLQLLEAGYKVVVLDNFCNSSAESLKRVAELTGKSAILVEGDIPQKYEEIEEVRANLDYDIDGLVVSVNNLKDLEALGYDSSRMKPKGQIAIKFRSKANLTTIIDILWSDQGGNFVVPIAVYDPIELSGATCSRASLKSLKFLRDKGVGIGSLVEVVRSGDVIPKIEKVIKPTGFNTEAIPTKCRHCKTEVGIARNEVTGELDANLSCFNSNCPAKEAQRLVYFLDSLRVKGLGWKSCLTYTKQKVTLHDFFQDDFSSLEKKIKGVDGISWKIWEKIKLQLEQ
jgi:NAD-dependent DNA ligase